VSEAPAQHQALAYYSAGKLSLAALAFACCIWGWLSLTGEELRAPATASQAVVDGLGALVLAALVAPLAVALWRAVTSRPAVWTEGGYLRWLPWGSAAIHDLVAVGPIPVGRGARFGVTLEDGTQKAILVLFLSIDQFELAHAIESLKLGLAARDGGSSAFD
jgi:hypothetical protein